MPSIAALITASVQNETNNVSVSIGWLLLAWIGLVLIQSLLEYLGSTINMKNAEAFVADLRFNLYEHINRLPIRWFSSRTHGDTLTLLTQDTHTIGGFLGGPSVTVIPNLMLVLGASLLLLNLSGYYLFLILFLVVIFLVPSVLLGRKIRFYSQQAVHATKDLISRYDTGVRAIHLVKAETAEASFADRFFERTEAAKATAINYQRWQLSVRPIVRALGSVAVILFLAVMFRNNSFTQEKLPEVVQTVFLGLLLLRPLSQLGSMYGQWQKVVESCARVAAALKAPVERSGDVKTVFINAAGSKLELFDVSFKTPDERILLDTVNLVISPGETVGIVGPNGSGKSTLLKLIMQFDEQSSGKIKVNEVDIENFSLYDYRQTISYMPQQCQLIDGTLRENLDVAGVGYSEDELWSGLEAAQMQHWFESLEHGWDSTLGSRGRHLSGGETQRLGLARTLIRVKPLVLLDESTSMLDPAFESDCVSALSSVMEQSTVVMVSHRPAILKLADRVFTLQDGSLEERDANIYG